MPAARGNRDTLAAWVNTRRPRRTAVDRAAKAPNHGLRFAFYGRVSTREHQDPLSSGRWQRHFAEDLIAGHGTIVAEYFDIGCSRQVPWTNRPQAAALLARICSGEPGFDAVVVGEYERAFAGQQLQHLMPEFARCGIQVWLPETAGPVKHHDPTHAALLLLLGAQSKREVQRARYRVTAAMAAQARQQGRYLGGRPPYGYRLVDAGPHPNTAHARWGRRLHRLEPDPATAQHVQWMFAQRLAGHSVAAITRHLNERGVPCPSRTDPDRNSHRTGEAWTLGTVTAILSNPRYTGRQVWNRHHNYRHASPDRDRDGRNHSSRWTISDSPAHPALVDERDFVAAQRVRTVPTPRTGSPRVFALTGLLHCSTCGRRLESHWVHGRPGYRCRHGHHSARSPTTERTRNIYVREDRIIAELPARLRTMPGIALPGTARQPRELLATLHAHNLTIICDTSSWTLAAAQTPRSDAVAPVQPALFPIPHQRAAAERD